MASDKGKSQRSVIGTQIPSTLDPCWVACVMHDERRKGTVANKEDRRVTIVRRPVRLASGQRAVYPRFQAVILDSKDHTRRNIRRCNPRSVRDTRIVFSKIGLVTLVFNPSSETMG